MGANEVAPSAGAPAERENAPTPRLEAERILVIRLGALGDVVRTRFAFPALRELYRSAQIDWLVEDRAAAGLTGIVGLDGVVQVPRSVLRWRHPLEGLRRLSSLIEELTARRYDLAIDFHGLLKSSFLAWRAGIPQRVGFDAGLAREGSQRLLTHQVRVRPTHLSRFERNAALVRFLGAEVPTAGPPPLELAPEDQRILAGLPQDPLVMHPGTSRSTLYKRWQPERYARVALELHRRLGTRSLVTWGPVQGERECAEAVVQAAPGAAVLAPETRSVGELLAVLSRSRLFIGSDSGPMHLACLAGAPAVILFGPTDPVENAPFPGVPTRVLRHDVGCNPCRRGCPARPCMSALEVEEVVKAALELIAARKPVD